MKKREEQDLDTGLSQENKNKPFSQKSKLMLSATSKTKEPEEEQSVKSLIQQPKKSQKSLLESESVSGSETIQKKQKRAMPVPKIQREIKERNRTEEAIKKLGVKPEILLTVPEITPTIKSCVKGGLRSALTAMRFASDDPDIAKFLKKYDSLLPTEQERAPWEAIAVAAKVNTRHLVGSILLAVSQHCATKSKFIVASNHPNITKMRVKFAKMIGGEKDRSALDIMAGAQQGPSGHTFIGRAWFGSAGGGNTASSDETETQKPKPVIEDSGGFDDLFPTPNEVQERLVPIRQRLLEG